MTTLAVLPVKRFGAAKQRLAPALEPLARRELAAAMVADVLDSLGAVGGLEGVVVVTGEPEAAALARNAGAECVSDPEDAGQSAAASRGVAQALERGAERVLLVPGDCPALDPDEIDGLLAGAPPAPSAVVVPDRHGTGTNGLLLAPPGVIEPGFGPGSRARHVDRVRATGAVVRVQPLGSLAFDVDTADDLAVLGAELGAHRGPAPRTRALLARVLPSAA